MKHRQKPLKRYSIAPSEQCCQLNKCLAVHGDLDGKWCKSEDVKLLEVKLCYYINLVWSMDGGNDDI